MTRFRSLSLAGLAALSLASSARAQLHLPTGEEPVSLFTIQGELGCDTNIFPQINAVTVNNEGQLCIGTGGVGFFGLIFGMTVPYEFSNLRTFINNGSIDAVPGVWFTDYSDAGRGPLGTFVNNGSISTSSSIDLDAGAEISYNMVWADVIRHKGTMSAPAAGILQLRGDTVIITNSATVIQTAGIQPGANIPFSFLGTLQNVTPTNFFGEVGIIDNAWSAELITNAPSSILNGGAVVTPPIRMTNSFGGVQTMRLQLPAPIMSVNTNQIDSTNLLTQGVFVQTSDADLQVDIRWIDDVINPQSGNVPDYRTAIVRLFLPTVDLVTGLLITNNIFIVDDLAKTTNYTTLTNLLATPNQRPANHLVTRYLPTEFETLPIGNVTNDPAVIDALFNIPDAANNATNQQAGYRFEAQGGSQPNFTTIGTPSITNISGRVEIIANTLDMARARIRGEGLVDIKANELISSRRAIVDSVNYNLDLGNSTNLSITDIVPPFVRRVNTLGLPVSVWSGFWTNSVDYEEVVPNPDPMQAATTNIITTNYIFHALVVDAGSVNTRVPTQVYQLRARSDINGPSVVQINDVMRVQEDFRIEARNIVINNELTLEPSHLNWDSSSVPFAENVLITPTGSLGVFDIANLGGDRRYQTLTNQGTIIGNFGIRINTDYFENTGDMFAGGVLAVVADTASVDGRFILGSDDLTFTNRVLTIGGVTADVTGNVIFNVSESLLDHPTQANEITAEGIQLARRPAAGDFMGSRVILDRPNFGLSENVWASTRNVGAASAGFVGNLAIGNLVLQGGSGSLYVFQAPDSAPTAIYIDLLEISAEVAADLAGSIAIAPNVTIYFADVRGASLDEILNTQFEGGGRFEWVSGFASSRSGVDFTLPSGETITINRLLAEADEDGDGTPNIDDPDFVPRTQLSGLTYNRGGSNFTFSWVAPAQSVTYLETTDNPRGGQWELVKTYSNSLNRSRGYTSDPITTEAAKQRYYRVRVMR